MLTSPTTEEEELRRLQEVHKKALSWLEMLIEGIDIHEDEGGTYVDSSHVRENLEEVKKILESK